MSLYQPMTFLFNRGPMQASRRFGPCAIVQQRFLHVIQSSDQTGPPPQVVVVHQVSVGVVEAEPSDHLAPHHHSWMGERVVELNQPAQQSGPVRNHLTSGNISHLADDQHGSADNANLRMSKEEGNLSCEPIR